NFGGFQLGLSWSPNGGHGSSGVTDCHSGQPTAVNGEQRNVVDAYANFSYDFDGWSLSWGGGGSWALSTGGKESLATQGSGTTEHTIGWEKNSYYQSGLNLTFGNFAIGAAGEYYHNFNGFANGTTGDGWVVGGGAAYTIDAWTVGFQYSHGDWQFVNNGGGRKINTAALTGKYAMGP